MEPYPAVVFPAVVGQEFSIEKATGGHSSIIVIAQAQFKGRERESFGTRLVLDPPTTVLLLGNNSKNDCAVVVIIDELLLSHTHGTYWPCLAFCHIWY